MRGANQSRKARGVAVLALVACLVVPGRGWAQSPAKTNPSKPLFVGEITGNDVLVRSGPSTNYYEVIKLNAGQRVTVLGERPEWYQIAPPTGVFSLIHKNFIDVDPDGKTGVVNGNSVLVRAGSALRKELYAKQLKLNRGDRVKVLGPHNDDYLRIEPPKGAAVYVSKRFVARLPDTVVDAGRENAGTPAAFTGSGTDSGSSAGRDAGEQPTQSGDAKSTRGRHAAAIEKLDAQIEAEMTKPIALRQFDGLLAACEELVAQQEDPYARAYATGRLRQLIEAAKAADAVRQLHELAEQVANERKRAMRQRNELHPPVRTIGGGFDCEGRLRTSALFASSGSPRWYRLIDDTSSPMRTIGYVEIPKDSSIRIDEFLGRRVGVRAKEKKLMTEGVDPIEIFVASELVVLDHESPGDLHPGTEETDQ